MPDSLLLFIAVLCLIGAAIAEAKRITRQQPTRINGWWHYQHPDDGKRNWMPSAWRNACDQSLRKSRERRGKAD